VGQPVPSLALKYATVRTFSWRDRFCLKHGPDRTFFKSRERVVVAAISGLERSQEPAPSLNWRGAVRDARHSTMLLIWNRWVSPGLESSMTARARARRRKSAECGRQRSACGMEPSLPGNCVFLGAAGRFGGSKCRTGGGTQPKARAAPKKDSRSTVHQRTIGLRRPLETKGGKRSLTWPLMVRALLALPAFVGCGYVRGRPGSPPWRKRTDRITAGVKTPGVLRAVWAARIPFAFARSTCQVHLGRSRIRQQQTGLDPPSNAATWRVKRETLRAPPVMA
jgi:hypothetical protein